MNITVKELLEAGVHFGHQTKRWNPKMQKYIFTARNGIYIIDLHKTVLSIQRAVKKVRDVTANGGSILMVGTKKQAKEVIREEAEKAGAFYVGERWLGGMLTNFQTIKQSIRKIKEIDKMEADGTFEKMTKKEVLRLRKHGEKLKNVLGGIIDMYKLPDLVFVVDAKKERIAVAEANKLDIPVIAIIDTNTDPDPIDYPIAGNDDAIKSISVITRAISGAVAEGKQQAAVEEFETETEVSAKPAREESPEVSGKGETVETEEKAKGAEKGSEVTQKENDRT
ncbi:MAG: 30S ribosomal protein S2 [candidate division Zixibacteria bacterium]|nr:30S ribosomal protein S2 [candidate division Zixibacteria bacterium]